MDWVTQIVTVALVVLFDLYVLRALRRELIDYKYALVWLSAGLVMLFFSLFPNILSLTASVLGIGIPLNMLFFFAILFIMAIVFRINITIANLKRRVYTLTQHVAVLENEMHERREKEERSEKEE
ncbi:MAG: DUF2304 domain-containing protein [Oscillospiraceae bacterium]|nr:DUF2304 domain-containing protein [Oscillospiraceae bacterium]